MFFRLLLESFLRQRRRKALAGIAILLGTTAITAMLALATTIGDRIHKELAVYGANIVISPKADQLAVNIGGVDIKPATGGAYLHESDLVKLKTIFWANNITGVSPELPVSFKVSVPGVSLSETPIRALGLWFDHPFGTGSAHTGAAQLHPDWRLTGKWPTSNTQAVAGHNLAARLSLKPGDTLVAPAPANVPEGYLYTITGIVDTESSLDNQLLLPLSAAQTLASQPDAVSRVEVSARTKPEDAFARVDPDTLPAKQREIWFCRPYANSIAYQIRDAIPGADAQQIRRVEQTEGTLLARISGLMWLIAAAALLAAGFAVSAAMATAVLERRNEIGLMRSLGASRAAIAALFYAETGLLALLFGTLGYLLGSGLAAWLGARIFSGDPTGHLLNPTLLPITVGIALLVALAGSTPSIHAALDMDPSAVLRADA